MWQLGEGAEQPVVAARGNVSADRSALEGAALHLRPDAMAQPVINEGEVGRGRHRALGWAQGGCGAGRTIVAVRQHISRRAGSQGGSGERAGSREEGVARKKCVQAWGVSTLGR